MDDLLIGILIVASATLIGSWGALFFKYCSLDLHRNIFKVLHNKYLYFGAALYGLSAFIFVFALRFGDLSSLYPIASLSYIWITLLSIVFLKEKMNDLKWFGILMIMIGIILIGFGV